MEKYSLTSYAVHLNQKDPQKRTARAKTASQIEKRKRRITAEIGSGFEGKEG
jgi:hypothetical protein